MSTQKRPQDWVHHNLHNGRVVSRESGQPGGARRVTLEADWVLVSDATPKVSAAGWKRSRTAAAGGGAKRSVHADIRGSIQEHGDGSPPLSFGDCLRSRRITYNPSRHAPGGVPVFHYADTGEEWPGSPLVLVTGGYAFELTPTREGQTI